MSEFPATIPVRPAGRPTNIMSDADYERARAQLRETYGDTSREAGAKRDQALARLFVSSGWTQERLSEKERQSRPYITQRLMFGRFLDFVAFATLPANLTEGRFRQYWARTDKNGGNERQRFQAVARLMQDDMRLVDVRRPLIGKEIKAAFADGKWHSITDIISTLDAPEEHIRQTLERMRKDGHYGVKCETKRVGTGTHYRLFPQDKNVSSKELTTKLAPIIKELKAEGKKNMATASPGTVAHLAGLLQNLLDDWAE